MTFTLWTHCIAHKTTVCQAIQTKALTSITGLTALLAAATGEAHNEQTLDKVKVRIKKKILLFLAVKVYANRY